MTGPIRPDPVYDAIIPDAHPEQPLRQALFVAQQRTPERWSKVLDLAHRTGLPPATVDAKFDEVSKAQAPTVNVGAVARDHPALAEWMQDADNATLAQHEVPPLARVAQGAQGVASTHGASRTWSGTGGFQGALDTGYHDLEASVGQLAAAFGLVDPSHAAAFVARANADAQALRAQAPAYAGAYQQASGAAGAAIDAGARNIGQGVADVRRGHYVDALGRFLTGEIGTVGGVLGHFQAIEQQPLGAAYAAVASTYPSLPAIGGATVGGFGGPVGVGLGTFAGMVPTTLGAEVQAELEKRHVDTSDPAALARAYADPALMASIRSRAERKGLTVSAVSALLAPFAGAIAARAGASGLAAKVGATAVDVGVQAAGQGAADLAGQVAGAKGDLGQVSVSEAVQAGVGALTYSLGMEAVGAARHAGEAAALRARHAPDPIDAAREIHTQASEAIRATTAAQALAEVGAAVKEAPTTASVPERLKQLVALASGGDGDATEAAQVYFQSGEWDQHFQAQGLSPAKAAADVMGDDGKAYYEAKATGAPLAIRLVDFVAHVAPTEHYEPLVTVARTTPDGMSLGEAHAYLTALPETMRAVAEEAQAAPAGADATLTPAAESARMVGESVAAQLRAAGHTPAEAETQGALYASTFHTMGQRTGHDPAELFARYGLTVDKAGSAPLHVPPRTASAPETPTVREGMVHEDGEARFVDARTARGTRRPVDRVSTVGLLAELRDLTDKQQEAARRAEYPTVESDIPGVMRTVATVQTGSGGVSEQAKAIRNARQYEKITADIEAALTRRGLTTDDIAAAVTEPADAFAERRALASAHATDTSHGEDVLVDPTTGTELFQSPIAKAATFLRERRQQRAAAELAGRLDEDAVARFHAGEWLGFTTADVRALDRAGLADQYHDRVEAHRRAFLADVYHEPPPSPLSIPMPGGAGESFDQPAYHGSPHIFDQFSLHAMGSGEGAQAFGWGLYFAGKKAVAAYYRRALAGAPTAVRYRGLPLAELEAQAQRIARSAAYGTPEYHDAIARQFAMQELQIAGGDVEDALARVSRNLSLAGSNERSRTLFQDEIAVLRDLDPSAIEREQPGRLYHVDIPGDETMLHWDKPLSEQPEAVRQALAQLDDPVVNAWRTNGAWEHTSGESLYRHLVDSVRRGTPSNALFKAVEQVGYSSRAPEAVSRHLASLGINGIKYLDGMSRGKGDGSHNYVVFDDKLIQIKDYEQRSAAEGPRGRITFGQDATTGRMRTAIDLFAAADRSTFLHETGHFYLHVLSDLASATNAPADLVADHATIRDWLGAGGDAPLTRDQHEQFARGFEAYLMEGKAPSSALRRAFWRFSQWLTGVYGHAQALGVTLSPEVRGVFDRMLASHEEIAAATAAESTAPLFPDPRTIGMSEDEATRYTRAVDDARQSAEEQMTNTLMRDLRRQESKEWKALRAPMREQVAGEVAADPVYRALALLQKGTQPDGAPLAEGTPAIKLDRDAVKAGYPDLTLPKGVTSSTDGVHPEIASEMLGFANGRELVVALAHAPAMKATIDALTDARMVEEHGERPTDAQLHAQAHDLVLGEHHEQMLALEARHLASAHYAAHAGLAKALARPVASVADLHDSAERIVGQLPLRDVQPRKYQTTAAKAARDAMAAFFTGDHEAAFAAKERQRLATAVYREAARALEERQAAQDLFKKVFGADAKVSTSRDMDLVNAARAILAAHGVGRAARSAESYLEQVRAYDPATYADVAATVADATTGATGDYRTLAVDDFRALHEAVAGLWTLARRSRQMEIEGQLVEREAVQGALAERLAAFTPTGPPSGTTQAPTPWERVQRRLMGAAAALRRVEHWADAMDEGKAAGVFRRYVFGPVSDAATRYRGAAVDEMAKYAETVKAAAPSLTDAAARAPIPAPELGPDGYTFDGKKELLGALLHRGNDSNLSKLLRGRGWGERSEDGTLDQTRWQAFERRLWDTGVLTKADYDYVQAVWDQFEGLKPGLQRAHKAMFGRYFDEVTATPFQTPFGEYRGGYVPAKVDPFIVRDASISAATRALEDGHEHAFAFPTAGRGSTKSRVEAYAAPLQMDVRMVTSHLDWALRFTHLEPVVRDVARVLLSRQVATPMDAVNPTWRNDMLLPWLDRAAKQVVEMPAKTEGGRALDTFARTVRKRTGMQVLAANVVNSVQQLTGVTISAVKVPPSHLAAALWRYARAPKDVSAAITEQSPYMRTRLSGQAMEIHRAIRDIMVEATPLEQSSAWLQQHAHFLTAATQNIVDHVTWGGAYDHAIAGGHDAAEAVKIADSVVRETQGSGAPEDVSRFEASTPLNRALAMFYGYWNMQANLLGTEMQTTVRTMGLRKGAGRLLAVYALGFAIPGALSDALQQAATGQPFDQDGDGHVWNDLLAMFFGSQFTGLTRMVPVVGPVADLAVKHFTGRSDDRLSMSAAVRTLEQAAKAPADVYHAIRDRQMNAGEIKDVLTALGLLSGVPLAPLAKPIGYLHDLHTGRAQPRGPLDAARGLTTGYRGTTR